jgi:N-acetylmuramoyl-L-alanine amidase
MKKIWYIDAGHGGVINNVYMTSPYKMHQHYNGEIAYEGVINRQIAASLHSALTHRGYKSIYLDTPVDIPLDRRTNIINELWYHYRNVVCLSIHSNASPEHNARGMEIWTSVGETRSDAIATIFGEQIMHDLPEIEFRTGYHDPREVKIDLDKEKDLHITHETACPAMLIENLFFDQWDDLQLLKSARFLWRLINSYLNAVDKIEKTQL